MVTLRRFHGGGSARKAPPRGGYRPARPWLWIALALAALGLEGCQSLQTINPFNPCNRGRCGLGRKIFGRPAAVDACEPGCEAGGITEGVPIETLPAPGAVITTPAPAPGAVLPPPPSEVDVPDLAPAPTEPAPPAGNGTSSSRGTDKSSYQTDLPREGSRLSRRPPLRRSDYNPPTPDPPPDRWEHPSPAVQLLDRLPPPAEEVTPQAAPAPRATAAEAQPEPVPPPSATTAAPSPPPAEEAAAAAAAAPGIRRFKVVEPQLAGGSFPTDPGWDWLVESGYKTVLDLREPHEVRPQDIAAIDHRGLRYVALPVAPATIDAPRVDRFREEIAQAGARPLYFCDTDGARAGVLWYIRRVGFDKIDPSAARREAEELGPIDPPLWLAAESYLGRLNSSRPAPAPVVTEPPAPQPAPAPAVPAAPAKPPAAAQASAAPRDPTAWRSYGALLLTMLAVPLAYWSRTGLNFRTHARASLPGSARRPRSLPPASGA